MLLDWHTPPVGITQRQLPKLPMLAYTALLFQSDLTFITLKGFFWNCPLKYWWVMVAGLKGLLQLQTRLYSGWGFLPSHWDRQLKFSAYASFCTVQPGLKFNKPFWCSAKNFPTWITLLYITKKGAIGHALMTRKKIASL